MAKDKKKNTPNRLPFSTIWPNWETCLHEVEQDVEPPEEEPSEDRACKWHKKYRIKGLCHRCDVVRMCNLPEAVQGRLTLLRANVKVCNRVITVSNQLKVKLYQEIREELKGVDDGTSASGHSG